MDFRARSFSPRLILCVSVISLMAVAGCSGKGGREPRTYARPGPRDPVAEARLFFEGYANGQGLGSEHELFEELITAIEAVDPAKAVVVARGIAEIRKNPAETTATAKKVLTEL